MLIKRTAQNSSLRVCVVGGLLILVTGCSSLGTAIIPIRKSQDQIIVKKLTEPNGQPVNSAQPHDSSDANASQANVLPSVSLRDTQAATQASASTPVETRNSVRDSRGDAANGAVVMAAYAANAPIPTSSSTITDTQYCPAPNGPGMMAAGCMGCGGHTCSACISAPMPQMRNRQEHLYDGGDQAPRVEIRQDWSSVGIEPSDTVVYYETESGEVCIQPTNRVAIYAPRFGAVRQVTGANSSARSIAVQGILAPMSVSKLADQNGAGAVVQPLAPKGENQISLLDAFQENAVGMPLDGIQPLERMSDALIPFEGVDVLRSGKITDEEVAVLGRVIQNANEWYLPESIAVEIDGQQANLLVSEKRPQDIHVFEIRDNCALRICKTASHTVANPGDTVNFTLRFDNAGSKSVGNVVIVDSLTARLEYIEGSQQSSIPVRFHTEANDVGSQVLRWEIEEPIGTGEGGVISFDCRVR